MHYRVTTTTESISLLQNIVMGFIQLNFVT